jgi:hypothetical protein
LRRNLPTASTVRGGHTVGTVSVGVACGSAYTDIDTLIARADAALYRAKADGRDRIEACDDVVPGATERSADGSGQNATAIAQPVAMFSVPLGRAVPRRARGRAGALCRS